MINQELRKAIIAEMKRKKRAAIMNAEYCGAGREIEKIWAYPTWWFKLAPNFLEGVPPKTRTKVVRRELERMEREGIVARHKRSTSNNTLWVLTDADGRFTGKGWYGK